MKKLIIIISLVLIVFIVLVGTLSSSKQVEGMITTRYVMYGPWIGRELLSELKTLENGKMIHVVQDGQYTKMVSDNDKEDKYYVGKVSELNLDKWNKSASTGGGKYLIKLVPSELKKGIDLGSDILRVDGYSVMLNNGVLRIMKNDGIAIWESNKSNLSWRGNKLILNDDSLKLGDTTIAIGFTGANVLTLLYGDLVIKNSRGQVVWSLLSDEIQTTNAMVKEYIERGSRIYQSIELEALTSKLKNYDNYINNLSITNTIDLSNYKALAEIRRQMDFEISQLNGKDGSKLAVSTNTLQSAMYLNLGITVLAASLFVLIATR